ncbi:MAG: Hpt domain-containing protein, partial [Desulfobacteraceae bacterium]|nr:Hpt domain-containing protein [Desulfobacteraceae bacterium]
YKEECLKAGMDDYISKPLRREKFLAIVDKWGSNTERTSVPKRANPPIDLAVALKEFEGDKEFLLEIIDEFILNVEKQLSKIKKAISNNDAETLQKEAHSITGGASSLTAYSLSEIAHELENIGISQNFENSSKVYKRLEKEVLKLKNFMVKSVL